MPAFEPRRLTDRACIRAFLNQDRTLTAYALGDLDDAFWPQSAFYGAGRAGVLESVVLFYQGLDPVVLTAFGQVDGVRAVFEHVTLPQEAYYLFLPEMEALLSAYYETPHRQREWRMVLDPAAFPDAPADDVMRILPEQADELAAFYQHAAEPGESVVAFSPWQIGHGAFYGVWEHGKLIATAGTHVWSASEGVCAIGNVFTRPDARGRGCATRCTAAVVREALAAGLDTIVLNVRQTNERAIGVYERLGFHHTSTFLEGPALLRVGSRDTVG